MSEDVAVQLARLERMKTMQAEYKTDIARLAEDAAKRDKDNAEAAGRRDVDAAKRETRLIVVIAGMIGIAVAVLGVLIRLPSVTLPG